MANKTACVCVSVCACVTSSSSSSARAAESLHLAVHRVSKDWQGANRCRYEAGLANEHEGDQIEVSSLEQVKDHMTEQLDSEGRHVQKSPE